MHASVKHLQILNIVPKAVLCNRNYLLRFRFQFWLLKSYGSGSEISDVTETFYYGSGSDFWKVMVPDPTFEKLWFRSYFLQVPVPVPASYLDHKQQIKKKNSGNFFSFLHSKLFYKEKIRKFNKFTLKCE